MALILSRLDKLSLMRKTGCMHVCEECGQRFRRMSDPRYTTPICGGCFPPPSVAFRCAIPYSMQTSSKGD